MQSFAMPLALIDLSRRTEVGLIQSSCKKSNDTDVAGIRQTAKPPKAVKSASSFAFFMAD